MNRWKFLFGGLHWTTKLKAGTHGFNEERSECRRDGNRTWFAIAAFVHEDTQQIVGWHHDLGILYPNSFLMNSCYTQESIVIDHLWAVECDLAVEIARHPSRLAHPCKSLLSCHPHAKILPVQPPDFALVTGEKLDPADRLGFKPNFNLIDGFSTDIFL